MIDHPTSCEDRCREMFSKWMQLRSTPQTWGTILVALSIVGESALANKIVLELEKKLSQSSVSDSPSKDTLM